MLFAVTLIDKKADLENEHHHSKLGAYNVVDVKFARSSIFTKCYRQGDWPTIQTMCGFVMRSGYPRAQDVRFMQRYETSRGAVYRLYVAVAEELEEEE